MKIFIGKFDKETLYGFDDEANRNDRNPHGHEKMAGVSARKVAEWRKVFEEFVKIQTVLMELYEGQVNKSQR